MDKPKISIIIPTYNVEQHIEKCILSILKQTYKNIEIIVIDDCSCDQTVKKIKAINKNNKIKIIENSKNFGAGYSRNVGINVANGEYVAFVDSDDYLEEEYIEKMYYSIKTNQSDISFCDIYIKYNDNKLANKKIDMCEKELTIKNVLKQGLAASPCNKLIKKSLIEKYPFAEGIINEDIPAIIPTIINAKKISYTKETFYNYCQHNSSVQNQKFSKKKFDILKAIEITFDRIKTKNKDFMNIIWCYQVFMLFLYEMPKEKNVFLRTKYLKLFYKNSKLYNMKKNKYIYEYLNNIGKKHSAYYKLIFWLNNKGLCFIVSIIMSIYKIARVILIKKVIKSNINKNKLKKAAIKQKRLDSNKSIKISVIVPNYNYERFLYQRIYSILNQKEKIYELIILDDCSMDNSRDIIDEIENTISKYISVKKIYNEKNSGSAFKQWEKGIALAKGDYIWVAEADDYCDKKMLKELIKPIKKDRNIVISYVDTALIDVSGNIILKSIKSEIDIQKTGHWNKNYINKGIDEIRDYSYLNCTISNVSSCLIKNGDYLKKISDYSDYNKYKQAGDWLFYINIMEHGNIAYVNKAINFYRVHGNNISTTMNQQKHLEEIKSIYDYNIKKFNLNKSHELKMKKRIEFLKKVWKI